MKTATKKKRTPKGGKWAKVKVYVVSIEDRHGRRVVKATLDREQADNWAKRFNDLCTMNEAYAWSVGIEIDVPPRVECRPAWRDAG